MKTLIYQGRAVHFITKHSNGQCLIIDKCKQLWVHKNELTNPRANKLQIGDRSKLGRKQRMVKK